MTSSGPGERGGFVLFHELLLAVAIGSDVKGIFSGEGALERGVFRAHVRVRAEVIPEGEVAGYVGRVKD